jgi:6,7-dimethyl-8-ribityllumazine synthase
MSSNFRAANAVRGEMSGEGMRFGVVCGRFNDLITNRLLDGVANGFGLHGVKEGDVTVVWVPGAFEIPIAAKAMAESGRVDAVITLGAVIRGDTPHFDYVAGECARGIQDAQLATGIPIVFGVLTTENLAQALDRSADDDNKGEESARTAIEMVDLLRKLR